MRFCNLLKLMFDNVFKLTVLEESAKDLLLDLALV